MYCLTDERYPIIIPVTFRSYKTIKVLSSGSFSVVALVEDIYSHQQYAAKFISKKNVQERQETNLIINEISILKTLDHPNIIKFYEVFNITNNENDEYIVIITDYCENGDLFDFIEQNEFQNEDEMKKVFYGILSAIQYLHSRGISHGDIKPENILLDKNLNPKLCDFGFAEKSTYSKTSNKRGSLRYMAPELFQIDDHNRFKSDIWSIGITFYVVSQKCFPFNDENDGYVIYQIKNGFLMIDPDDEIQNIISRFTKKKPDERASVVDIMNDSYFSI